MIEGVMRHGTSMNVEGNYVDSHGQSEIGFAITSLLGFKLLARIKQINRVKLYGPDPDSKEHYPLLAPAMTRPIRWELIEQNYDMLVKYATAIRVGTATTEAILRRFSRNASHPVYQAMLELGRAQKTIFVTRYLRDRDLQREINSGLNIVEGWHDVNDVIFFGKSGELASNRRDQQELAVLALHLLQAALIYINTLMLQDILAEPEWAGALTDEDKRGLTPLFTSNMTPYGEVKVNMTSRLNLSDPRHRSQTSMPSRPDRAIRGGHFASPDSFVNGRPRTADPGRRTRFRTENRVTRQRRRRAFMRRTAALSTRFRERPGAQVNARRLGGDRDLLAGRGVAALALLLRRLDADGQLHHPPDPYLLGVAELFEHDLLERGERSLRVGLAQLRAVRDSARELGLGQRHRDSSAIERSSCTA